jgi:malonyl CoA-acyl carrier protein transacylase
MMNNKCAFLFPGQGAQYVGMGKSLYETFSEAKAVFEKAGEILGWDIKKRCFEGPGYAKDDSYLPASSSYCQHCCLEGV